MSFQKGGLLLACEAHHQGKIGYLATAGVTVIEPNTPIEIRPASSSPVIVSLPSSQKGSPLRKRAIGNVTKKLPLSPVLSFLSTPRGKHASGKYAYFSNTEILASECEAILDGGSILSALV